MDNDAKRTAKALAALGHEARLSVFQLLVRAGQDGLIVGQIALYTGLAASTLAHHLRALVAAGLVRQEKRGREVVNFADYAAMNQVLSFLTRECCQGVAIVADDAAPDQVVLGQTEP